MHAGDRETLAAELKRAFESVAPASAKPDVPSTTDASGGSISFTQPLLRAVFAVEKTQTRRPIRPVPASVRDGMPLNADGSPIAPLYRVGERLWVREKWARLEDACGERFVYAIDGPNAHVRWNSSRFMPRAAARTFLRVTQIDIARLTTIRDEDAVREGIVAASSMFGPRAAFMALWDSIYGDGEFASALDPWVWIVSFERATS